MLLAARKIMMQCVLYTFYVKYEEKIQNNFMSLFELTFRHFKIKNE